MAQIAVGTAAACVVLLLAGSLALRVREVFFRDGVWARLWAKGPWKAEPVRAPDDAPERLRRFERFFASEEASVETVAEVRFRVSADRAPTDLLPSGRYLAVLAWPHGFVLRHRSGRAWRGSGFTCLDGDRLVTRHWVAGLVPTRWRTVGAADARAADMMALASALSLCWTPAAVVRSGDVRWGEAGRPDPVASLPDAPPRPELAIVLSPDGSPARLTASVGTGADRAALGVDASDFADFGGYRLPCRLDAGFGPHASGTMMMILESLRYSGPWTGPFRA